DSCFHSFKAYSLSISPSGPSELYNKENKPNFSGSTNSLIVMPSVKVWRLPSVIPNRLKIFGAISPDCSYASKISFPCASSQPNLSASKRDQYFTSSLLSRRQFHA